jgi:hypothetical protein
MASRVLTLRRSAFVDREAFALPTAHHALSGENSARFGYDRALCLAAAVGMKIDNDPIPHLVKFMRASGVREQRGEVPFVAVGMQNWKPSLAFRIEALGSDCLKFFRLHFCMVFAIDIKQDIDRRLIRRAQTYRADAG